MNTQNLDALDWIILVAYFVVLIAIGMWASSKAKKSGNMFLASRSLRWHHIGFSMWGTNVGPSMLIASASAGFSYKKISEVIEIKELIEKADKEMYEDKKKRKKLRTD